MKVRGYIETVGSGFSDFLRWNGGITRMVAQALARGPRRPVGLTDIAFQILALGIRSLPLATLMSVFVGMILAWQFGEALAYFGAKSALGTFTSLGLVRELIPIMLAMTVGSKMATGIAAELGSMKVTEQIDAIAALGADPIKKLVWPRIVAAAVVMPLLVAWGNLIGMMGGSVVSHTVFEVPAAYFFTSYIDQLVPMDYVFSLVKAEAFGLLAGCVGCYQGMTTKHGTAAVGMATTETVVATSVTILLADFALTSLFLPVS